jgi:putative transposase
LTHEAIRDWETRFAPLLTEQLRMNRRGQAGKSCYVDETSIKVHGKWCSLYRAIDQDGNLVDSRLSEKRDMDAAKQCFRQALAGVRSCTRARHDGRSYVLSASNRCAQWAVRCSIGKIHTSITGWNKIIGVSNSARIPCMARGSFESAARFCCAAGRITQVSLFAPHDGKKALTSRTATGFSPATCSLADIDGSYLVGQINEREAFNH